MRWKITTKKEVKDLNEKQLEKKTIVTRAQYITVGDIVGAGKSAAGAVQKLAKTLPGFINKLKDDPKGMAMAIGVNSIITPLATMITGMDQYKKVMGVIDTLTPIMKLVARATGVWCSPGNAADIAQIALGTAQQILIQIATSSILKLKEMVWNYEFKIREISNETSMLFTKKIKEFDKNNTVILNKNIFGNIGPSIGGNNNIHYNFTESKKRVEQVIDQSFPEEEVSVDVENIINILKKEEPTEEKKFERRVNYVSEYALGTGEIFRVFAGSLNNTGIYYSDDNGKTWNKSNINVGSFNTFEKIFINGQYRYIAGSTEEVISIEPTTDINYLNENNEYYKDYYNENNERYLKIEKDEIIKDKKVDLFNDPKKINLGKGIYYSDDNGKTWNVSSLDNGKFENIKNFNNHLVASSYDYEGVYYSDDGETWTHSKYNGLDIDNGRWTIFRTLEKTNDSVTASFLENNSIFDVGKITLLEELNSANQDIKINMDIDCYQGEGFEDFATYNPLVISIVKYLHERYNIEVMEKTNDFWDKVIREIMDGTYTMEDAINGKYI